MTWPACSTCSIVTSKCVTARTSSREMSYINTPCSLSRAANSAAVPSFGSTLKITMFVSTISGSSARPRRFADRVGQRAGLGVVFGQPVDVVLQRVERPGGDDAGLPHAAAEHLAMPPRAGRINSSGPHSAEPTGAPSPFEKQMLTVSNCAAQSSARNAGRHHRVEQPRAVQVAGQSVIGSPAANLLDHFPRLDPARAAVVRVFQAHQPCADVMVVFRTDAVDELLQPQHAVLALDRLNGDAEQLRVGPLLVAVDVALRFAKKFVARLAVQLARQSGCSSCRRGQTRPLLCPAGRRCGLRAH